MLGRVCNHTRLFIFCIVQSRKLLVDVLCFRGLIAHAFVNAICTRGHKLGWVHSNLHAFCFGCCLHKASCRLPTIIVRTCATRNRHRRVRRVRLFASNNTIACITVCTPCQAYLNRMCACAQLPPYADRNTVMIIFGS